MWFWNFIEKSIPNQTNPHSGKPTSSGFRLGGQAVNTAFPSEGQACWVPEGSGQAVPTTQPAPIYYRGMLSYCKPFLVHFQCFLYIFCPLDSNMGRSFFFLQCKVPLLYPNKIYIRKVYLILNKS